MVKTNGLDSRDPDFNDFGFSDFLADYNPTDEQLVDWMTDDPDGVIKIVREYNKGVLEAAWCDTHEEEIENEWDSNRERDPDEVHDSRGDD